MLGAYFGATFHHRRVRRTDELLLAAILATLLVAILAH